MLAESLNLLPPIVLGFKILYLKELLWV